MYNSGFLPVNTCEMQKRGWDELDFILITGDAYVDHPSFGIAIIARILEYLNFKVGIIAQPKWQNLGAFRIMGKPRFACLISGGNLDSMVNHYTAAKKKRSNDAYSPGGKIGFRPDRATIVYSNRVREALPGIPVIIGGIEASLRRFAHYDYWSNKVNRSILLDSQADMLVYGMGEKPILEIAGKLAAGMDITEICGVRGTMVPWRDRPPENTLILPDWDQVKTDKRSYAEAFRIQYQQQDPIRGKIMYQKHNRGGVLQYPPALPLSQAEMDKIYSLPFAGTYHSRYEEQGGVPAIKEVKFSLVSSRGCYGACSFCALTFHQGRIIQSRSAESILSEAERLIQNPHFKGYIHDVGGPTANFRHPSCSGQLTKGTCNHRQCLFPQACEKLNPDHREYIDLLRRLRELPQVKKVFIRSGVRYDTVLADRKSDFLEELCKHHVSGQLKVAPEHISDAVLKYMGKPGRSAYEKFVHRFQAINQKIGKKQYLVPYLMSSHPGSSLKEAIELAEYIRDMGVNPEQVQDFIPTPGTLSACMYFTGLDPRTMEKVYVPKSLHEKAMQKALIQYRNPANYELVKEALLLGHREDLIGFGPKCLIKPRRTNLKSKAIYSPDQRKANKKRKTSPKRANKKGRVLPTKI
ncbi:MAG: YgiQ family radical SAM protein [Desulfitobacteriaceae bacterium]|nr:YgiQ family radical SAM protein [Desulfitobacteriaceae bacterium]MDD4345686.1 YgiQ family radical SAM protein [Desulfitobacteriaceae bacterium]MDD4401910.1 YgiQ family radical SAM protein [Desulfitobacteriaceae bacterium]